MITFAPMYPAFSTVLQQVEASIEAEQIFCSIVTEMEIFFAALKDDANLKKVHAENYETSYHKNTAAGNLQRLLTRGTSSEERLVLMTIECLIEAREHQKIAERALFAIKTTDPASLEYLTAAKKWHARRKYQLKLAARTLAATVGPELWEKGAKLAES